MTDILKLITITFVIITYKVKYFFRCRDVIFIEILGILIHIFLSVIFSWIRLVKGSKSGGQKAKITQICFSKVQHWLQYLCIFIWCQKNVAHEEKCFFSYEANIWNVPKPRWRQFFTFAFIEVLLINKHTDTVKHSYQCLCDKKTIYLKHMKKLLVRTLQNIICFYMFPMIICSKYRSAPVTVSMVAKGPPTSC